MRYFTKDVRTKLPSLYATENTKDPMVICRFYTPGSSWSWYALEFDGVDRFFGLVKGLETELGYFSLKELESFRGPFGLPVVRDTFFTPCRLSKVKEALLLE